MSAGEHKSIFELLECDGVDKLTDFNRPKRMKKKNADRKRVILQKITGSRYLNNKQLETETAMALSSHHRALMYQLSENIENFLVFQDLLDRIQKFKKRDGYKITGWMGAGLRTFGGAIRSATVGGGSSTTTSTTQLFSHFNVQEALEEYIKKGNSYAKVGGNFFRKMGEKLSGETTTIMRVIKRTLEKKNPFLKTLPNIGTGLVDPDSPQSSGFEEEEEEEEEESSTPIDGEEEGTIQLSLSDDDISTTPALNLIEGKDEELSSLVFALLKNFDGTGNEDDPSLYYVEFLLNYGFSRFGTDDLRVPYYYDQMFFLGLSKYVFYEHFVYSSYSSSTTSDQEKLEKMFISQCHSVEKRYVKRINFQTLVVDVESITFSEVKTLKEKHFSSHDENVKMEDIRQLKEELEKRDEKDRIYALAFRKMFAHWEKYKLRYEKQFGDVSGGGGMMMMRKRRKSGNHNNNNNKNNINQDQDDHRHGGVHESLLDDDDDDDEEEDKKSEKPDDDDDDDSDDFAIVPKKKKKKRKKKKKKNGAEDDDSGMLIGDDDSIFNMNEFQESLRDFPTPKIKPQSIDYDDDNSSEVKKGGDDAVDTMSILKSVNDMRDKKKKKRSNDDEQETNRIFEDDIPVSSQQKMITNDEEKSKKDDNDDDDSDDSDDDDDDDDLFAVDVRVTNTASYDDLFEKFGEDEELDRSENFVSLTKTQKEM